MNKISVVIADDNPRISAVISEKMLESDDFQVVATVTDGILALKAIETFKPDLLLLDIIMPNLDGLGVLEKLNEKRNISEEDLPKVIVLSGVGQDEVTYRAMDLGASYYMIKPFDIDVMMMRIRQFLSASQLLPQRLMETGIDSSVHIANVMNRFGIPTHTKGYHYIKEALTLIDQDLTLLNKITTALYPAIAKKFDSSPTRVERSIRNTIELSIENGNKAIYEKSFSIDYASGQVKITNGDFISVLTSLVRDGSKGI